MARRILIVEDNAVNLELVVAVLEDEGYTVLTAGTASAGLHLVRTARPDLILMDVQLPGVTGYEAARQLKADPATARIPIVAVTAHAMRGEEARAGAAGCDGYLTKPVSTRALLTTLQRLLPEAREP